MSYSNHETTEFALYIENTEPLWRDIQQTLDETYEEDRAEGNMVATLHHVLQMTADRWYHQARVTLMTFNDPIHKHGREVACLYLSLGFEAIDCREIANVWVENYLTERNME